MAIRWPTTAPPAKPAPNNAMAWIKTDPVKFIDAIAVTIPPETPMIPAAFPILAVF